MERRKGEYRFNKSLCRIAFTAGHCLQNETTCNMREEDVGRRFFVFSGMYTANKDEVARKECKVEIKRR